MNRDAYQIKRRIVAEIESNKKFDITSYESVRSPVIIPDNWYSRKFNGVKK